VLQEATERAKVLQPPTLRAGASTAQRESFAVAEEAWLVAVENAQSELADQYTDYEKLKSDYDSGQFFSSSHRTPYLPTRTDDPLALALTHVKTGKPITLLPNWYDATENYLTVNRSDKLRDDFKQREFEKKMRSLFEKFGLSLGKQGSRTPLKMITRQHARSFKDSLGGSTGNRYNNIFSAVINCWIREFGDSEIQNPFKGLSNKAVEQKQSIKRRSFTPTQWRNYVLALTELKNKEIGLIGLIMAYTGCRTSEAAGLALKDVKISEAVPHLIFRSNSIRRMEKGGLERAVPIFEPLLNKIIDQVSTVQTGNALFEKYGAAQHFSNVSAQLNGILRKKLSISDKELVAYSFRHTVHDKGRAARIDPAIHEYIVGHLSAGSSRIHRSYGTFTPPKALIADMKALISQESWDSEFD
jgi:integrase